MGGVTAELFKDTTLRLLPPSGGLSLDEALDLARELKTWPLLDGFRGRPKADVDALATAIVAFSQMTAQLIDRLAEAEINPLFVLPAGQGVRAADGVVVLGGSKVSDKLAVIESLAKKADSLLIGGGMCFSFLASQGASVGTSLLEESMIETCKGLLDRYADVLHIPQDVVIADSFSADAEAKTVPVTEIPDGWMGLDIGPESVQRFASLLSAAKTVFWNGPMGVFEFPKFAAGTKGVAEAIVDAIREPLLVLDPDMRVIAASRSFYRTFAVTPRKTEGRLVFELGDGQWNQVLWMYGERIRDLKRDPSIRDILVITTPHEAEAF